MAEVVPIVRVPLIPSGFGSAGLGTPIRSPDTGNPLRLVPNLIGDPLATAETILADADLVTGTITFAASLTIPAGNVMDQDPAPGTLVALGAVVNLTVSTGIAAIVPNLVTHTVAQANDLLTAVGLVLGTVNVAYSDTAPVGTIISQIPGAGFIATVGDSVRVVVSLGPQPIIVPNLVGLPVATARGLLAANKLDAGNVTFIVTETIPIGDVAVQNPLPGTLVLAGATVDFAVSVFIQPFDPIVTVISQYANSPTIQALISDMAQYMDPRANLEQFYFYVWNVDTAQGFGLDILGRIVNVNRLLRIPSLLTNFGFEDVQSPPDYTPFNNAPFNSVGGTDTQTYELPDDAYRVLVLTKALANISATTAPALNTLLRNLFPGRGRCYVLDLGGMAMQFTFEFNLTPVELAILLQSGALPHGAGVRFTVVTLSTAGDFGFVEALPYSRAFNDGPFYNSP